MLRRWFFIALPAVLAALSLVGAMHTAFAQGSAEVPLIPRAKFFGNPEKARARLSHDGKRLAYVAPVEGVLNVWASPDDNPANAKPMTFDKHRGIVSYMWAYTNKHILYTQDKTATKITTFTPSMSRPARSPT